MVKNMYTMLQSENSISSEEKRYSKWLGLVSKKVGYAVSENGLAYDLYADGCTAHEAAEEILAVNHG